MVTVMLTKPSLLLTIYLKKNKNNLELHLQFFFLTFFIFNKMKLYQEKKVRAFSSASCKCVVCTHHFVDKIQRVSVKVLCPDFNTSTMKEQIGGLSHLRKWLWFSFPGQPSLALQDLPVGR